VGLGIFASEDQSVSPGMFLGNLRQRISYLICRSIVSVRHRLITYDMDLSRLVFILYVGLTVCLYVRFDGNAESAG
jgi:hypothetical protein